VGIQAGVGEGDSDDDDGGEAEDKNDESAHGASLWTWVRGWLHGSSLRCGVLDVRWMGPGKDESTRIAAECDSRMERNQGVSGGMRS
jgi:hypothetical protein